jgi:hypothetical protein
MGTLYPVEHNWAAMFAAFIAGSGLDEIARTFAVESTALRELATTQDWASLASRVTSPLAKHTNSERNERNRERNLLMAELLRDRLIADFESLKAGTLTFAKQSTANGVVVTLENDPGPQDLVAYANAAKAVSEITYRALGDEMPTETTAPRTRSARADEVGTITVVLPAVVRRTKELRTVRAE